jgi:hypothetical protein
MASDQVEDILAQFDQVAEERFQQLELEAARNLIRDALGFLPWELQDGYYHIMELYREGKRSEAAWYWQEWLAVAREMGLI